RAYRLSLSPLTWRQSRPAPQLFAAALVVRPWVLSHPGDMAVKVRSPATGVGTRRLSLSPLPSRPYRPDPQQYAAPEAVSPQVCAPPEDKDEYSNSMSGSSPFPGSSSPPALSSSPPGSGPGAGSLTTRFSVSVTDVPRLSVTVNSTGNVPASVGVPEMTPEGWSMLRPEGSPSADQRYGGVPPDASRVAE